MVCAWLGFLGAQLVIIIIEQWWAPNYFNSS